MRLTEFRELMTEQFGRQVDAMLADHVLVELGGQTGAEAIEAGVDPRDVWVALCRDFDVPRQYW